MIKFKTKTKNEAYFLIFIIHETQILKFWSSKFFFVFQF